MMRGRPDQVASPRVEVDRRGRIKARIAFSITHVRRSKDVHLKVHNSEHSATSSLQGYTFEIPSYFIKPREPTVLSPKEYHEISPTNLLLSAAVRLSLPNDVSCSYANSWLWVGSDSPRDSRNPGYRKVQRRTGQRVVELSIPRRKTGEAGYTRCALDGTPSLICSR